MGNTVEQWRAVIGGFNQPMKSKSLFKSLRVKDKTFISLGIRVVLFLLLVVGGVESNPGPGPPKSTASGHGRGSRGSAQGMGPPRGRGSAYTDYFVVYSDSDSRQGDRVGGLRRSQRLRDQPRVTRQASSNQTSLSAWLMNHPPHPPQSSQPGHSMARDSERRFTGSPLRYVK